MRQIEAGAAHCLLLSNSDYACTSPHDFNDNGIALSDQNLLISAEQLEGQLSAADIRLMDCRFDLMQPEAGRTAYLAGHIPGAVYADLDRDLAAPITPATGRHPLPHPATLAATFGRLGISARTRVVVYDENSGALAARAWWLLRWLGHENVSLLDGGIAIGRRFSGSGRGFDRMSPRLARQLKGILSGICGVAKLRARH